MIRNADADEFVAVVKAITQSQRWQESGYISHEEAQPFVQSLPEFWREPARVMACCGYYASADGWMKEWVEGKL